MIPIGKITHRDNVRETHCVNGVDGTSIPAHVKIAVEGEPIRTLGAWVGNNVEQVDTWSKTLEMIEAALEQWDLGHPAMEGRRLIVLMVVGGMAQYLTEVQGMPKEVEEKLEKRIRSFVWAEKKKVTINKETGYAPAEEGRKNLPDIVARNEAISITWLRAYLTFGEKRPMWAFVTDEIMSAKALGTAHNVEKALCSCPYLQSWRPKLEDLSEDLKRMAKTGDKYDLQMEALAVSREIQRDMPIWYHAKSTAQRGVFNRGPAVGCLRKNHGVRLVCDAELKDTRRECRPRRCSNSH
ncbi:hypothetical protein C8J57DRAFT_1494988 [Mycena rebaudengoi]|nr:hypothetical protein C8J57DRAFT_1494988 [Mycena rebaudengoi]